MTKTLLFDTPLDERIHRPPARVLAALLAKTPITPNQVTLLSLVPAFFSGVLFLHGSFQGGLLALFFFWLWAVLDHTDGELARLTNSTSSFGQKLDDLCDHIASISIFCGIFFGLLPFWNTKDKFILEIIFSAVLVLNIISLTLVTTAKRNSQKKHAALDNLTGRDLFYLLILFVLTAFFWGGPLWFSFVMGVFIVGLFLVSALFLLSWLKISQQ